MTEDVVARLLGAFKLLLAGQWALLAMFAPRASLPGLVAVVGAVAVLSIAFEQIAVSVSPPRTGPRLADRSAPPGAAA